MTAVGEAGTPGGPQFLRDIAKEALGPEQEDLVAAPSATCLHFT